MEVVAIVQETVTSGSAALADEAAHSDALGVSFPMGRINHSEAYSQDGVNTNWMESYFARLRRMVDGQHHHISPRYLFQYANEAAWKEDHRRLDNGAARGKRCWHA